MGILESCLICVEINTKKYLFIFLWFQAVFRNLGKLAYVDSRSHKRITAVCGVERVPSFLTVFDKSSYFFNSSTLLLAMRGDYSGTLMILHICHIVAHQSKRLGIGMSSLPSCGRWVVTAAHEDSGTICVFPQCPEC